MICINLSEWNWSIILTVINIMVTIIIPIYIYKMWHKQKKYEAISNSSSMILKEVIELRENIYCIYTSHNKGDLISNMNQRDFIGKKANFIDSELKAINKEIVKLKNNKNRSDIENFNSYYKDYMKKTFSFIKSIDSGMETEILTNQGEATNKLAESLSKIKFYNI